ncbi:uncharacterized protein LOC144133524 [Amblyomma americanum]
MGDVVLQGDRDASELTKMLDNRDPQRVMTMKLTNCILADPDALERQISRCTRLQNLHCLSTRLKPSGLVRLLLGPLQQLRHLEFSIVVKDDDVAAEVANVEDMIGDQEHRESSLVYLYVELVNASNFALLLVMLPLFPMLNELHVHVLRGLLEPAFTKCSYILRTYERIATFKMTSEVASRSEHMPGTTPSMVRAARACGNVMQLRSHTRCNYLRLSDLAEGPESVHSIDPVLLIAYYDDATPSHFAAASGPGRWQNVHAVQRFCMLLFHTGNTRFYPHANTSYFQPLCSFFGRFTSLAELNINSFHCAGDIDMTAVLATARFPAMRALSISPCALQHSGAVSRLSELSEFLEDLDIRFKSGGYYNRCATCLTALVLEEQPMADLQARTELMRFTLAYVPEVSSYQFLRKLTVAEVRLIESPCTENRSYTGLNVLLSQNLRLRRLVIVDKHLAVDQPNLQRIVGNVVQLRLLVLCSEDTIDEDPVPHWLGVADLLANLEVMHVHFRSANGSMERMTWLRRPETDAALQGVVQADPDVQDGGWLLHNRPCVVCSTETFIGLVKPHNRGTRTHF